jgi:ABC-type glycerol-3-phosphate transport system substrate-binding protein
MRKTLLALALGLTALAAAACGGSSGSPAASDILQSVAPIESPSESMAPVESPSVEAAS